MGVPAGAVADVDGDGTCDAFDRCPGEFDVDTDHDGFLDCLDPTPTVGDGRDVDLDGVPPPADGCDGDPLKTVPGTCGCGVSDVDTDADGDPDCLDDDDDGDGYPDATDPCDLVPFLDSDGDGLPDCIDPDDDDDGTSDQFDRCAGMPDADADATGVPDCLELRPPFATVLSPDGAPGDGFGSAVAIDGDRLAIGEPGRQRVSIFERMEGQWTRVATVGPVSDTTLFGQAVAMRGELLVVGASSAIEVHARIAGGRWDRSGRIASGDLAGVVSFYPELILGDGFLAVGAAGNGPGMFQGSGSVAFARVDVGGAVTDLQRIDHPAPTPSGMFGVSLAVAGDRFAVAARSSTRAPGSEGFIAVWRDDGSGPPVAEGDLVRPEPANSYVTTRLGFSLAVDATGGVVASTREEAPMLGFRRIAPFAWTQVQSISGASSWLETFLSPGFDSSSFILASRGGTIPTTVRIDRLLGEGRSELLGFLAPTERYGGGGNDTVGVSGVVVAVGIPGFPVDGESGPGIVRVFDLCDALGDPDAVDCDGNGRADGCEIEFGARDDDRDGRLDCCERAVGDVNLDGEVDADDLAMVLASWGGGPSDSDVDGDGIVGAADLTIVLGRWGPVE